MRHVVPVPAAMGSGTIRSLHTCSHGAPRPEDDPANFEGGKRVRGPSESEVKKAQEERRKVSVAGLGMEEMCPAGRFMFSLGHSMTGCWVCSWAQCKCVWPGTMI